MASVDGEVLLDRTLRSLLEGGVERVVVVTAPEADFAAASVLRDARVETVVNPDPARGMWSSIREGLAAVHGDPVLVLPADMPFVRAETVTRVLDAAARAGSAIVVPAYRGRRGHPVAMPGGLRQVLIAANARSLKEALAGAADRVEVGVDDPGVLRDVDVPSDL